jgi:high-affinity nickel permease
LIGCSAPDILALFISEQKQIASCSVLVADEQMFVLNEATVAEHESTSSRLQLLQEQKYKLFKNIFFFLGHSCFVVVYDKTIIYLSVGEFCVR